MKYLKITVFAMLLGALAGLGCAGCSGDDVGNGGGEDGGPGPGQDGGPDDGCAPKDGDCSSKACCTGFKCENDVCVEDVVDGCDEGDSCDDPNCCGDMLCSSTTNTCVTCLPADDECADDSECCAPTDALQGVWCGTEGTCEICVQATGACETDFDCCPPTGDVAPLMCTSQNVCAPICERDSDCDDTACDGKGETCMPNGECVCPSCSTDDECNGKKCCSGDCKDDCGYGSPAACAITTPGGIIYKGQSLTLVAVAYSGNPKAGGQIIPWTDFVWSSTATDKVAVNAATGEITGKDVYGTATINAKAGSVDCGTVKFTNYLPEDVGKVRVLVIDERTGKPIEDATVVVGANAPVTTDAMGLVQLTSAAGDVHVYHKDYTYVSIVGSQKNDLVVHLTPKIDHSKAGGFAGEFDFSKVKDDAIQLGLAGNSIAGNLLDLDFNVLIGEMILTHLKLSTAEGAPADFDDWIGLPGALVLKAKQFGAENLIPEYRILGEKGLRTAWGIGGGLPSKDITKLIQILAPIIGGGGDIPIGQIVAAVLPLFNKFQHGVQSIFEVVPIDKIDTPCIDLDTGSADSTAAYPCEVAGKNLKPLVDSETMADYAKFPDLALQLATKMALKTVISLPDLPKLQGKYMGGLAILGGVNLPDMGMVPLGITAGLDNPDDPMVEGDGKVNAPEENPEQISDGQVMLRMSPNHDGTETNKYMFAMLVLDFNSLGGSSSNAISGRVKFFDKLDPAYNLTSDKFLTFAEGAVYDNATRKIVGPTGAVAGAAFYRYKVSNGAGDWFVYTANASGDIVLPAVPAGIDDRADDADMSAHAISLTAGNTLDKLVSAEGGQHLNNLFDVVDAFSHLTCQVKIVETDGDYAEKCQPTDPTKVDPACNPVCEVKPKP